MEKGYVQVFCGNGEGKTSAAIGKGLSRVIEGKKVIVVQFLKAKNEEADAFFSRMEPELKFFRFQRHNRSFEDLNEDEKTEEINNIRNGLNYAKKVLSTGECDLLILDEIIGLVDKNIMTLDELVEMLEHKSDDLSVIMTGISLIDGLKGYVDIVSKIENVDFK